MRNKYAAVSDPNTFFSNPGDDTVIIYGERIDKDGSKVIVQIGKESMSEKLKAWLPFTDISYIVSRLKVGDTSVLNPNEPFFGEVPKGIDFRQVLDLSLRAQEQFYQLDLETREMFDNDWRKYTAVAGTDEWYDKMVKYFVKAEKDIEPDGKESDVVEP